MSSGYLPEVFSMMLFRDYPTLPNRYPLSRGSLVWSGRPGCWGGGLTNQSLKFIEPTRAFCKRERPLGHLLTILHPQGMSCHSSKKQKQEMEKKGKWSIMSFLSQDEPTRHSRKLSVSLPSSPLSSCLSRSLRPAGFTSVFVHIDAMQCNAITLSILLLLLR